MSASLIDQLNKYSENNNEINNDIIEDEGNELYTPSDYEEENSGNTIEEKYFGENSFNNEYSQFSKIKKYFTGDKIKLLYYICLSYEIRDNNIKADLIGEILGNEFQELGTGTNRIAFLNGKYVYKLALDRRGIIDNVMEFRRSKEAPQFLARTYETNGLIAVQEYVTSIEPDKWTQNREPILALLSELAKNYIFGDFGYDSKNYCNLGYRDYENGESTLVVLDYAYMNPRLGNEKALKCTCGHDLEYNSTYTKFKCNNPQCNSEWNYIEILRKLNSDVDNLENQYIGILQNLDLPDMANLNFSVLD